MPIYVVLKIADEEIDGTPDELLELLVSKSSRKGRLLTDGMGFDGELTDISKTPPWHIGQWPS